MKEFCSQYKLSTMPECTYVIYQNIHDDMLPNWLGLVRVSVDLNSHVGFKKSQYSLVFASAHSLPTLTPISFNHIYGPIRCEPSPAI